MKIYIVAPLSRNTGLINHIEYVTTSEKKAKEYANERGYIDDDIEEWELYD